MEALWWPVQIDRMTLEAEHVQDPSVAPVDHQPPSQQPPVWRGLPVQMQLPPHTGPVKVGCFLVCCMAHCVMIQHIGHCLMPCEAVGCVQIPHPLNQQQSVYRSLQSIDPISLVILPHLTLPSLTSDVHAGDPSADRG